MLFQDVKLTTKFFHVENLLGIKLQLVILTRVTAREIESKV